MRAASVGFLGISLAALCVGAFGVDAPRAQTAPEAPAIVLPPLPDADINAAPPAAARPGEAAHEPQAEIPAPVAEPQKAADASAAPDDLRAALAARIDSARKEAGSRAPFAALAKQRAAIAAFYAARGNEPLWLENGKWTPAARAAMAQLEHASDDALDVKATPLPALASDGAAALAEAELALSAAVVNYAWQAQGGRIDPRSISRLITEPQTIAEPAAVLASVAKAEDAGAALRGLNPPQPGYGALRDKLAELRRDRPKAPEPIAPGPTLKVGMKDFRAPALRARLGIALEDGADDQAYDAKLAEAVANFQRANSIAPSGQLTPRTVAAFSGGDPAALEDEVIANMERWRWEPRTQTQDQIEVNIPDYMVTVTLGGAVAHRARVIVGKPDKPTPVFSNRMQFIEVNPYWNVPQSIIKNEMLPRLAKDPTYLQRMGYEVSTARDGRMIVRQPPGERNALGRIKFMFPNEHAVYLHDTPTRGLFNTPRRAYSHGCVRVDDPFKFAEIVLGKENGWTAERAKRLIGGRNQTIPLPRQLDIHIEYFTAFIDDAGKLQTREDIYGYSRKVRAALGLNSQPVAAMGGAANAKRPG